MRASSFFSRAARGRAGLSFLGCLLALLASAAVAQSAFASSPTYSLSIVEGVTTLPEFSIENTSASASNGQEVVIKIIHDGTEVAKSSGHEGTWTSKVPAKGDEVKLESPEGNTVAAIGYDGLPSIDSTVCAGSTNFSGQRSEGELVKGGYFTVKSHTNPYGYSSEEKTGFGSAQVTTLSGMSFSGSFLNELSSGQTVYARESVENTLSSGAIFKYSSETLRPVGACPAPPPPTPQPLPPPPPPPPPLKGEILKLIRTTIAKILKSGWSDVVGINQAGTVTQDLYLQDGTLPAYAASAHKRRHKAPPALLLARGSITAKIAGDVTVSLKLTTRGRRKLKAAKSVKVILITTLRTSSGHELSLGRRSLSLHR
jgi:hypothetical protein